ncbi:MarR family winged helix-turn-helix transcriptional regulator [Inquilinus limosus]|uniref:HTH marR-type domain-containing protein n=1 Tax=Inquilinus limosus MP06 TaxID=1398085 RepID=A0A0A0DBB4_9PROT|nr:MarR family winged helix-turn-helix transcriptional regulator [Inquilinus limosus]KGM35305.1 hypothetical protein P409_05170 [Inquilinus limosus MP06]
MSDGLAKALRFIREVQKLDPSLTIACVHTLLVAAGHEGRSIGYIVSMSSVSKSAVSRHIQDLGASRALRRIGGTVPAPGLGLVVTQGQPEDGRERIVFLTPRGRELVAALEEILQRP